MKLIMKSLLIPIFSLFSITAFAETDVLKAMVSKMSASQTVNETGSVAIVISSDFALENPKLLLEVNEDNYPKAVELEKMSEGTYQSVERYKAFDKTFVFAIQFDVGRYMVTKFFTAENFAKKDSKLVYKYCLGTESPLNFEEFSERSRVILKEVSTSITGKNGEKGDDAEILLSLINKHRARYGLKPLTYDLRLNKSDGSLHSAFYRPNVLGVINWSYSTDPQYAFNRWINLPEFNENLLDSRIRRAGFGFGNGTTFIGGF